MSTISFQFDFNGNNKVLKMVFQLSKNENKKPQKHSLNAFHKIVAFCRILIEFAVFFMISKLKKPQIISFYCIFSVLSVC